MRLLEGILSPFDCLYKSLSKFFLSGSVLEISRDDMS